MKVIFKECSNTQANWGSGADPRKFLTIGETYDLLEEEVHSYHTLFYLYGFREGFNSVCFEKVIDYSEIRKLTHEIMTTCGFYKDDLKYENKWDEVYLLITRKYGLRSDDD